MPASDSRRDEAGATPPNKDDALPKIQLFWGEEGGVERETFLLSRENGQWVVAKRNGRGAIPFDRNLATR